MAIQVIMLELGKRMEKRRCFVRRLLAWIMICTGQYDTGMDTTNHTYEGPNHRIQFPHP